MRSQIANTKTMGDSTSQAFASDDRQNENACVELIRGVSGIPRILPKNFLLGFRTVAPSFSAGPLIRVDASIRVIHTSYFHLPQLLPSTTKSRRPSIHGAVHLTPYHV